MSLGGRGRSFPNLTQTRKVPPKKFGESRGSNNSQVLHRGRPGPELSARSGSGLLFQYENILLYMKIRSNICGFHITKTHCWFLIHKLLSLWSREIVVIQGRWDRGCLRFVPPAIPGACASVHL